MNEALVQHAQDDVDDHQRRRDQVGLAAERVLEGLRRTLERPDQGRRLAGLPHSRFNGRRRIAERDTGRQIERQSNGGELALVVDRQIVTGRVETLTSVDSGTCCPVVGAFT